jgi:hypothetical protein
MYLGWQEFFMGLAGIGEAVLAWLLGVPSPGVVAELGFCIGSSVEACEESVSRWRDREQSMERVPIPGEEVDELSSATPFARSDSVMTNPEAARRPNECRMCAVASRTSCSARSRSSDGYTKLGWRRLPDGESAPRDEAGAPRMEQSQGPLTPR